MPNDFLYDGYMKKQLIWRIIKEFAFLILQIFFSRINLFGFISPAGLPFAFIRLFFGGNIFITLGSYFISKIYLFANLNFLIITIYEIVLLTLYYFAMEFLKTKKKILLIYCFLIISNALSLYYNIFSLTSLWHFFVNFSLQIIILFYFYKLFAIYKNKFIFFKFSHKDYLFFSIAILMLSVGAFEYEFILKFIGYFMIAGFLVALCKVMPVDKYFVFCTIFSLGMVIASKSANYIIFSAISSIIFFQLKQVNKYVYIFSCLATFAALILLLKLYGIYDIIMIYAAVVIYAFIPTKLWSKLKSLFDIESAEILRQKIEEEKIKKIQGKLLLMSSTLTAMQNNFKYLLIGKIDRSKACKELANDIISKCCGQCEYYKTCFLENMDKKSLIENLMFKAIEQIEIGDKDFSNGTLSYCSKNKILMNEINQTAKIFLSYEKQVKNEDSSKLIIASEIQNFANIFLNFAKMIENSLKINEKQSKALKEILLNNMIDAKEVAIIENPSGINSIDLVLTNEQAMKKEVIDSINRLTKLSVKLKSAKHLEYSGICHATYVPISKIKPEFAVATKSKESKNGDNVVITKLSENKFFVAIADGMGHGEAANKISGMVLSLIRSLFEVGLDETLIISSINKLLIPAGLENFTSLDACVIDLEKNICDFVKLGASVSIIKHKNTSEVIVSESLPIGIVQNIKPTIVRKQISSGDMIFLASDGIVDSFENIDIYKSFINDAKIFNLQKYLDEVVVDAGVQNQKHIDDMTIIGINLLKN